tara:strand:+ start:227 stop:637 length:411 start_codon:yes stop_codon:yes gene_type:complete
MLSKHYIITCLFILFLSSCEKSSINSCPYVIKNSSLADFPMNEFGVNEIDLIEDQLFISVNYGGGCENHDFKMILHDESSIDEEGQQIKILSLSHDANNDVCFALILEHELCFNISNIENDGVLYFSHTDSLFVLN